MASPAQSTVSASGSSSTPTSASASTVTPASYAASVTPSSANTSRRPYPLSASQAEDTTKYVSISDGQSAKGVVSTYSPPDGAHEGGQSRIPVTPAVLRSIFASSRTPGEERSLSRIAFFRFSGFLLSCLAISLVGNRVRGIRGGAALLGVGM